jgi:putative methionine-R-sulfoxide reductase with GAF domain
VTDPGTPVIASGGQSFIDDDSLRILQSMLSFARVVFSAPAASTFTYNRETDELVFEAASGVGADILIGRRMPATAGIAAMVIQTGMATIADDLASNTQFNREFAAQSGYVPQTICAAPLLYDDDLLGVIEVLDPDLERFGRLDVMTIVESLADNLAESLHVLLELRHFKLANRAVGSKRTRISNMIEALPEDALTDNRSAILEAVLTELSRSHT